MNKNKVLLRGLSDNKLKRLYVIRCIEETPRSFDLCVHGKYKIGQYYGEKYLPVDDVENAYFVRTEKTPKDYFDEWFGYNQKFLKKFLKHFELEEYFLSKEE